MRVQAALAGAMLAQALGGAVQAQGIVTPDWLSRPDGDQVAQAYPRLARALEIEGRATVSCSVTSEGRLRNCVTMQVSPPGLGFDAAALELTELFRMTPLIVDGRPRPGGSVRIPIRFTLPKPETNVESPAQPGVAPAGNAALSRRLEPVLAREIAAQQSAMADVALQQAKGEVDGATWAAAAAAMHESITAIVPEWGQAETQAYGVGLDETEFKAMLDFKASPVGTAYEPRLTLINMDIEQILTRFAMGLSSHAREALCAKVHCGFEPWLKPTGVKLVNPRWERQPDERMLRAARPPLAQMFDLPGWAQLNCIVGAKGGLESCIVARQSPDGMDFGEAAQSLSPAYNISPEELQDGAAGETVAILVRFPAAPGPTPLNAAWVAPKSFAPTATSLALARQIVAETEFQEEVHKLLASMPDQAPDGMTAVQSAAMLALRDTIKDDFAKSAEAVAEVYASAYSLEELRGILAWEKSPVGRTLGRADLSAVAGVREAYQLKVTAEARKRFCAQRPCEIVPAP